jgi:hypothetical protein
MRSRAVRILVFACSLLLAFPPAWCCMALDLLPVARADDGDAEESAPAKSSCCCCKGEEPTSADAPEQPVKKESPAAPCRTGKCCWDRLTMPPQPPQQFQPDHVIVAVLPPVVTLLASVTETGTVSLRALPVSPPIHVFDCVWLC